MGQGNWTDGTVDIVQVRSGVSTQTHGGNKDCGSVVLAAPFPAGRNMVFMSSEKGQISDFNSEEKKKSDKRD